MAGSTTSSKNNVVKEIFKSMDYGPVPVSTNLAKAWLKDRNLGPFIDGSFKETASQFEVFEPCTKNVIVNVGLSTEEDITAAVNSSLKAVDAWSKLTAHKRACHLYSLARHIQKYATLVAQMETLNRGVQIRDPKDFDVPVIVRYLYHYAGWAQLSSSSELSDWKPLGVVAGVTSSLSPLMTLALIIAPALAAGNTVCLKPPQSAPLPALLFASIATQAGLPPGVINVLPGGSEVGKLLVTHSQVSKVTFFGLTSIGRLVRQQTAGLGTHLTLQLSGGKSSMLVFDSADLDSAVDGVVTSAWFNQGQVPWSVGRLFVQESIWNLFVKKLRFRVGQLHMGEVLDNMTDVGSPINKKIVEDLASATTRALKNGLEVFQTQKSSDLPSDSFFPPTLIIGGLAESNHVVDEDTLLPLVSVVPFRTAKEAVALANNSRYGLTSSVWSENAALALEVAYQLQVGTVWINSHGTLDAAVPFSGWKQSGIGVFGGKEGLLEYMQYKGVRCNMTTESIKCQCCGITPDVSACLPTLENKIPNTNVPVVDRTYKLYYGGAHKRPDGNSSRIIRDGTGKVFATVSDGSRKDVRNAVEAAVKIQPTWWKLGAHGRAQIIYNAAEKLQSRREDFISHLTLLYGKTDEDCAAEEVDACLNLLFHWAANCDKKQLAAGDVSPNSNVVVNVRREPLGVIGAVQTPTQSPHGPWALLGFISLFAPAVCYGNTVIVIADSQHPTPALEFCQVVDTSDFPPGVINLLTGDCDTLLATLATHQEVAALWAPGIKAIAAKHIEWASSTNLKRTWVDKLPCYDSLEQCTDCRELFELHSTRTKAIWVPCGEIFAN